MALTDNPLVSVILVTYNSSRYVLDTLNSIKDQTWKNIELIITDDGSTDSTVDICADWLMENKKRFHTIKVITVPQNTGIPSNCNRGMQSTNGEWIKMIGGDDILLEGAIAENLAYARQHHDALFITSDIREIDEDGTLVRDKIFNDALIFFSGLSSVKKQLKNYSRWPAFLNSPAFFFKKELFEKINYFDEEFKIFEDISSVIRVLEKDVKLHYMEKVTVAYRIYKNSISRNRELNNFKGKEVIKAFHRYRKPHLNPFNIFDLSACYEWWLGIKYMELGMRKGQSTLRKLSLYYWYMKAIGIKSY